MIKLKAEGYDPQSFDSVDAVQKALSGIEEEKGPGGDTEDDGIFKVSQIVANLEQEDVEEAQFVADEIYENKISEIEEEEDKDEKDKIESSARPSIKSSLTREYKERYLTGDDEERNRIKRLLKQIDIEGKALYKDDDFKNWEK